MILNQYPLNTVVLNTGLLSPDDNSQGQNEKYISGENSYSGYSLTFGVYIYYILPTGNIYELPPDGNLDGPLLGNVGVQYYDNPPLLIGARFRPGQGKPYSLNLFLLAANRSSLSANIPLIIYSTSMSANLPLYVRGF
jgi:hypothetical protein